MSKPITLTDATNGNEFKLEYDRDSVVFAESIGFSAPKASDAVATDMVTLFRAAFHKNHPGLAKDVIYRLWDNLENKQDLFEILMKMFQEPYETLLAEPKAGGKGNVTWKVGE